MKKKLALIIISLLLLIFLLLGSLLIYKAMHISPKGTVETTQVDTGQNLLATITDIERIETVLWQNDSGLIMVDHENNVYLYNLSSHNSRQLARLPTDTIVGINNNEEIIKCQTEIFEISEPDEIATKITVSDLSDNIIAEIETTETITPVNCSDETIFATPAYYFLEEEFFQINILTSNKEDKLFSISPIEQLPGRYHEITEDKIHFLDNINALSTNVALKDDLFILDFSISQSLEKIAILTVAGDILIFASEK